MLIWSVDDGDLFNTEEPSLKQIDTLAKLSLAKIGQPGDLNSTVDGIPTTGLLALTNTAYCIDLIPDSIHGQQTRNQSNAVGSICQSQQSSCGESHPLLNFRSQAGQFWPS